MGDPLPSPVALTVAFVSLWALLVGLVVLLARRAERLQGELSRLKAELESPKDDSGAMHPNPPMS